MEDKESVSFQKLMSISITPLLFIDLYLSISVQNKAFKYGFFKLISEFNHIANNFLQSEPNCSDTIHGILLILYLCASLPFILHTLVAYQIAKQTNYRSARGFKNFYLPRQIKVKIFLQLLYHVFNVCISNR